MTDCCLHGFQVRIKFDGGRRAVVCGGCDRIVGYLGPGVPDGRRIACDEGAKAQADSYGMTVDAGENPYA